MNLFLTSCVQKIKKIEKKYRFSKIITNKTITPVIFQGISHNVAQLFVYHLNNVVAYIELWLTMRCLTIHLTVNSICFCIFSWWVDHEDSYECYIKFDYRSDNILRKGYTKTRAILWEMRVMFQSNLRVVVLFAIHLFAVPVRLP